MNLLVIASAVLLAEIVFVLLLSAIRRLGAPGLRLSDALCHAPLLDVVVALMTLAPPIVGAALASWSGLAAAVAGQIVAIQCWIWIHEGINRKAARQVRLIKAQHAVAGRWRNSVALWFSLAALPLFWALRITEILVYPPLRWLLRFPEYKQGEWVSVSRHKFDSLVGQDLIWCMYCDWMTGIYSFGAEMLRNVESFWCPIRFYDGKKCENCRIDFPDIDHWAVPDETLKPAVDLFQEQYGTGERAWFGHPVRLTINGDPAPEEKQSP